MWFDHNDSTIIESKDAEIAYLWMQTSLGHKGYMIKLTKGLMEFRDQR